MASDFEIFSAAGAIYAASLLDLAQKAGTADEIGAELEALRGLWQRDPGFAAMMSSAAIDVTSRRESLRKIFGGRVSPLVLNLMLVLNDHRRAMVLPHVCEAYRRKLDAMMGRAVVHVTSAMPLDDSQRQRLAGEVQRRTGKAAKLVERVDPNALAGLAVQIGDQVYDYSARRRLEDIRKSLMGSVQRHLIGGAARFISEG